MFERINSKWIKSLKNEKLLIKSVLNKDENHYYFEIYLEKCLYQLAKK